MSWLTAEVTAFLGLDLTFNQNLLPFNIKIKKNIFIFCADNNIMLSSLSTVFSAYFVWKIELNLINA